MAGEDKLVQSIAKAALEEKALNLVVLDVREITVIADYFVICSGRSTVQIQSIANNVEERLKEEQIVPTRREGYPEGKWIVLDFGAVIFHVFRKEEREYYNLENLWGDAPQVSVEGY